MGFCPRFSNVAVALLASTLLKETVSQLTQCNSSSTDFDYEVTVGTDSNFDIRWSVDTAAETISFEVSSAALAWVGVGFSSDGMMTLSDAVIGLPDSNVTEYNLTAKNLESVREYEEQEITDTSIFQETDTTMTFTRPLAPSTPDKEILSAIPGDQTWLIYAFGDDNELAPHAQENRGSVLLDLFCGDDGAGSPTPTMDPVGTNETVTPIPTPAPVDGGGGGNMTDSPTAVPSDTPTGGNGTDVPTPTPAPVNGGGSENTTDSPTAVPSDPTGGNGTDVPTPTPAPVNGGGGGNMTDSPTAVASDPPTGGNGTDVPTPNMTDTATQAPEEGGAAYRVSGGLWATAATVTAAVLGAAMAV